MRESQHQSTPIHILDDDSLLNIFHLYRPALLEDEANDKRILWGGDWARERWWYKIAQVCRRWRCLLIGSATHLRLCLVCTYGTPVADMLAHSPPLPLVIDYGDKARTDDEVGIRGILLALHHRDRVRRIRLQMSSPSLRKLTFAMNDEFQALEYLYISPRAKFDWNLLLPRIFRAPRLQHLVLINFVIPIGSPLLITSAGLVTLSLSFNTPSPYFHPHELFSWLSLMPQLETLRINCHFYTPLSSLHVEGRLHASIMKHVTLPNLRWFGFRGFSSYLETLLPHMTTPLLEKLQIAYSDQFTFAVQCLLQFMNTTKHLRLSHARLVFNHSGMFLTVYPHEEARVCALFLSAACRHLDWQLPSALQIFNMLSPVLSAVVYLGISYQKYNLSSGGHNETDRAQWRELLRSFSNVRTLRVAKGLVMELSPSLQVDDDGESLVGLLPELKVIECSPRRVYRSAFVPFINARRVEGRVVIVTSPTRSARKLSGVASD